MDIIWGSFLWNPEKAEVNERRHGVHFEVAAETFKDPCCIIFKDSAHSKDEQRWFCVGRVGDRIITVRFTYRQEMIRIIGAGPWRKWRKLYETQEKKI
jgi:hypothetical protein